MCTMGSDISHRNCDDKEVSMLEQVWSACRDEWPQQVCHKTRRVGGYSPGMQQGTDILHGNVLNLYCSLDG